MSNDGSGGIYTGSDNDTVQGTGGAEGIANQGLIQTEAGNDVLLGFGGNIGIVNEGPTGTIDTGDGIENWG